MGSPKTSVLINDITIYSENIVPHKNERHFPDIIGNYKEIINFKLITFNYIKQNCFQLMPLPYKEIQLI